MAPPLPGLAARAALIPGSLIDSSMALLQRQTHDVVRFAMGSPGPDAIPTQEIERAMGAVFAREGSAAFDYGPTEGEQRLREALPAFLERNGQPAPCSDQFLITSGGMQGLDLACKLLLEPGDTAVVESPTYTNAIATIASYEAGVLEAPVDEHGLVVDALPELVRHHGAKPKLIYTIPNLQNPRGTTLTYERRVRLLELAEEWGASILEDDPYGLLHFDSQDAIPSLWSMAPPTVRVIAVHTFSKILAPGIRVGWVMADPDLVAKMIDAKQGMDTCTNVPLQLVVAELLERRELDGHIARLRPLYARRKSSMSEALGAVFAGDSVKWTDPSGGFYLWLEFGDGVDANQLFELALAQGVAFIPGSVFTVSGDLSHCLRLCFASTEEDRIRVGVERLAEAVAALRAQPAAAGR
jgi:2-aminoadipate transaminase